jgi:hypothetical protein
MAAGRAGSAIVPALIQPFGRGHEVPALVAAEHLADPARVLPTLAAPSSGI